MSFGFGVGDFLAVGKLAWAVYKSCKDAPESFSNMSTEVLLLHAVLKEVEEALADEPLTESKKLNLATIGSGCHSVLSDLQILLTKYESMGPQSRRTWDRMKWGSNDVTGLRARLTSNTILLTTFLVISQVTCSEDSIDLSRNFKMAIKDGSEDIVRLILYHIAKSDKELQKRRDFQIAYRDYINFSHCKALKLFLDHRADINFRPSSGESLFTTVVVTNQDYNLATFPLFEGVNVDWLRDHKAVAMYLKAHHDSSGLILLMGNSLILSPIDDNGAEPLDWGVQHGFQQIARHFLDLGALSNIQNRKDLQAKVSYDQQRAINQPFKRYQNYIIADENAVPTPRLNQDRK
ncbi:hypothetical protein WAI453_006204 [Rhynchosporium graminicola]